MDCPKCGYARTDGGAECPRCGIVFARYAAAERVEPPLPPSAAAEITDAGNDVRPIDREGWKALAVLAHRYRPRIEVGLARVLAPPE